MNDYTRIFILLFGLCFFWVYNTEAFANTKVTSITRCFESGGIIRCIQPDGTMTTIVRG